MILDIPGVGTAPYAPKVNAALQLLGEGTPFFVGLPAAGAAAGKDKAAALAAINAAKATAKGGTVLFGPGVYDLGDLAVLLPDWNTTGKTVNIKGVGPLATTLLFSTDRGLGTYAIAGDGPDTGNYFNVIEDVGIQGPGTLGAINTSPANMDGVRLDTQMKLNRVGISLFRSAVVSVGNHSELRSVETPNNYFGLYFTATFGLGGDILVDNCKLSGVRRASIAVAANVVATFTMIKGHLGFAPYCVLFEPTTSFSLGGVQFIGTSFEYAGNSFFYSTDQTARVQGVLFDQCGNFSRNFATYGIAAQTYNPAIYVSEWIDVEFRGGMPQATADGGTFDVTSYLHFKSDLWKSSFDSAVTAGVDWILASSVSSRTEIELTQRGHWKAFTAQCFPGAAIVAGNVLEHDQLNRVRPWGYYGAGTKSPLAGIALNGAAAGAREQVVVVTKGPQVPVLSDGAAASSYTLIPSASTAGKASGVVYNGTQPLVIGPSYAAVAVPTTAATHATQVDIK